LDVARTVNQAGLTAVYLGSRRYDRPMAAKFEMDPRAASAGLAASGQTRSEAMAAGIPTLPVGNYVAPYMTALGALLAAGIAETEGVVATGMATSAASATAVDTTETASSDTLTI
jgi:hypothetical protein